MKFEDLFSDSFQQLRASFHTAEELLQPMVGKMLSTDSRFCKEAVAAGQISQEDMLRAAQRYLLGKSRSGEAVFWMIDQNQRVRDAIVSDTWASLLLKDRGLIDQHWCPQHCLFGLHLLCHTDLADHTDYLSSPVLGASQLSVRSERSVCHNKPVCVVESVRSCIILSERFPKSIWMATGYLANLNVWVFLPLKGHQVVCFPATDLTGDTYLLWLNVATEARKYGLNITVSRFLEDHATSSQKSRNIDLVDYIYEK